MTAPVLAVGDGALGFWKAVRDVFPETAEQRCWWHKIGNVLVRSARSRPTRQRRRRWRRSTTPRTRPTPEPRRRRSPPSSASSGPRRRRRSPTTSTCCSAFYDYPAEHWIHLRTTQPDRVDLRHRPAQNPGHQGPRQPGRRRRHGLQADRISPGPLADGQRTPPGRRWSAPAPSSSTASLSNDPETKINKEVISKRRETRRSTGIDYSSCRQPEVEVPTDLADRSGRTPTVGLVAGLGRLARPASTALRRYPFKDEWLSVRLRFSVSNLNRPAVSLKPHRGRV